MKKPSLTLKKGDLSYYPCSSWLSLLKAVSLGTAMTSLLSSVSPVIAANFVPTEQQITIQDSKNLQIGHLLSSNVFHKSSKDCNENVYFSTNRFCGVDIVAFNSFDSKKIVSERIITEGNYDNLIERKKVVGYKPENSTIWHVDGRMTIVDPIDPERLYLAIGQDPVSEGYSSVAIGNVVVQSGHVTNEGNSIRVDGGSVVGGGAVAEGLNSIALGVYGKYPRFPQGIVWHRTPGPQAMADDAIAIGADSFVDEGAGKGIAIGKGTRVNVLGGVALGYYSTSSREGGVKGYDPLGKSNSGSTWISQYGGFDIGGRQITGVSAGSEPGDAVNVAQLKSLQEWVKNNAGGGWKLSVNGTSATDVYSGSIVDFSSSGSNLIVSKDSNKVKFDLAKEITVDSVKLGASTLSKDSLAFAGGVSIGHNGISAGNKKITGLADGAAEGDAVNFKQLKEVEKKAGGWKLSVGGAVASDVASGSTVDFSSSGSNLIVSKDSNKVKFDLAKEITVDSVKLGASTLNEDSLVFSSGVSIGRDGVSAGNKKITKLADGTAESDAVNFKQLKEVEKKAGGWKLSVGGAVATDVAPGSAIDFSSSGSNLILSKDSNKVTFDLAKKITVDSVKLGASTLNEDSLAFASGVSIGRDGISAGNKKITNLADGTAESDAVNFKQLKEIEKKAGGWKLSVGGAVATDVVPGSTVDFSSSGKNLLVSKDNNKVTFDLAKEITVDSVKLGASTLNKDSLVVKGVGKPSEVATLNSSGLVLKGSGDRNEVGGVSLNSGGLKFTNAKGSITGPVISVAGISAGNEKITNLKDGTISAQSTEAITGKQLFETNSMVASYFGGKAGYAEGKWTAPTYNIRGKSHRDVGSAFVGVNDSLTDIYSQLTNVEGGSLVQQEESEDDSGRITVGAKVGGTEINFSNKDGQGRTLSGLKDGTVSAQSTEAITGKQLFETNSMVASYFGGKAGYAEGKWTAPTYEIQGELHRDVGSAFVGVNDSLTDIYSQLTNVEEGSLVQQEESEDDSGRITVGAKVGGTEINLANKDEETRKLSGLKDGMVSAQSTEAITGKQLFETNTKVAEYFGGKAKYGPDGWIAPTFQIIQFNSDNKTGEQQYKTYNNVASAFDGINRNMEDLDKRLNNMQGQLGNNGLHWNEDKGVYDASREEDGKINNSKLTGVADGAVEKGSSDVVTGNQLWETNQKVNSLENKVNGFENSVGQMVESAVQYDKDEDGNKTNKITLVGGDASAPVIIDNVGDGKVEKDSKEAINGGQLYEKMQVVLDDAKKYTDEKIGSAISEAKEYTDMKFDTLSYNLEGVRQEARQAAAIGLAVSNLRYEDAPGALSIAFSSGLWRSQSAIAFGAGYTSEDGNIRSNVSITTSGGHWGIGAGISVRLK
ncbi:MULTISPECIES: YadA-like family protein [unclassified Bartonella]|uniref:YadA-like family protein n=1 Tax=unclassified Bartonella TaxID=2645622 RepID=UPI000998EECC|nr:MULTISPECIES: YadA-like family protein [unclassified Bartonella]AQX28368.1 Coiled stalk of trimeric autotransporter adhesin [Bartonella sp. JB15]AQX29635.1 Coiled stalk of trimeric autotransporter adhesin [Bartonella sp. JB63]